ncbi:MAG TPA: protein phosphatase 2C domain-containing protein [Candidatus Dormibacteraeota bacterium]|nr:protein phosphatase 2C domain-containing protein [Candidatus Dormibacteraeota bacterium]
MTGARSGHATRVADGAVVLELAALSDRGPNRSANEDAWAILPLDPRPGCALLLADGMGGHADGAIAAYLAVHGAGNVLRAGAEPHLSLPDALAEANEAISRHRASRGGLVAGTTLVAAVVGGGRASIANVGDSRAYLRRGDTTAQLTFDHSWVAEQVRAGQLGAAAVAGHPHRSLLTRALTGDPVEVDLFTAEIASGDTLLLCTDGLWDALGDAEIGAVLGGGGPLDGVAAGLCDAALAAGASDNLSVVLCRVA